MALFLAKHIFLFTLFFLAVQVHARDSVFFSKVSRPTETPLDHDEPEARADQPALQKEQTHEKKLPRQSHNGYGLYGRHGPEQSPSSPPTTADAATNGFPSSFPKIPQQFKYSPSDNIPSNEYETEEWSNNDYADDDKSKQYYGMSDTRFLENGRYYYDVNEERDRNMFGSQRKNNRYYERNNSPMDGYQNINQEYQEETREDQYIP